MTTAFWCILAAGLMPYAATLIAKGGARDFNNADPRAWLQRQEGFRHRANAAQLNSFEVFPLFAAAVLIAAYLHAQQARIDMLALGFLAARVAYLVFYLANIAILRSLAWLAGMVCVVAIFVAAT
jgi:uncharacterized MAPEG superfamily protein